MKDESNKSREVAEMAFASAFRKERGEPEKPSTDSSIDALISRFEEASQIDESGVEYWTARELYKLLGYTDYRNFLAIVSKAIEACRNSGQPVRNHFVDVNEMVEIGSSAERQISDIRLTRYAAYLIAQNGDSRKNRSPSLKHTLPSRVGGKKFRIRTPSILLRSAKTINDCCFGTRSRLTTRIWQAPPRARE